LLPERHTEIKSITKRVWLVDEFLLRDNNLMSLRALCAKQSPNARGLPHRGQEERPPRNDMTIAFHPHCHQRAEGLADDGFPSGTAATVELLRAFGFEVDVIDSGCCGMAGTFGYDVEHYELSMQIGELKLFPYLRELGMRNEELGVVSTGSACRLQIKQGVGKDAKHPLVVIAKLINKSPYAPHMIP